MIVSGRVAFESLLRQGNYCLFLYRSNFQTLKLASLLFFAADHNSIENENRIEHVKSLWHNDLFLCPRNYVCMGGIAVASTSTVVSVILPLLLTTLRIAYQPSAQPTFRHCSPAVSEGIFEIVLLLANLKFVS